MTAVDDAAARLSVAPYDHTDHFIVVRDGETVAEHAFGGKSLDDLVPVKSITKAVLSTVVMLAVRDGALSLGDTLADLLGDRVPAHRRDVTVRHLLTMTSGAEPMLDTRGEHPENWLDFVLARRRVAPPGEVFAYDNLAPHALAGAVHAVIGDIEAYAAERIFAPAGITRWHWSRDPQRLTWGQANLELSARSLAALGEAWRTGVLGLGKAFEEATSTQVTTEEGRYGHMFWVEEAAGRPAYLASGWPGQGVFVVPDAALTIVVTADVERWSPDSGANVDVVRDLAAALTRPT